MLIIFHFKPVHYIHNLMTLRALCLYNLHNKQQCSGHVNTVSTQMHLNSVFKEPPSTRIHCTKVSLSQLASPRVSRICQNAIHGQGNTYPEQYAL